MNVFLRPRLIDGKPAMVRDPASLVPLAAAGEWKPRDFFWERRLRDGDVIEVEHADATELRGTPGEPFRAPQPGEA